MCYEHFTLKNWRDWGSPKQEFWRCFVCPATMQVILRERMDKKERKEKKRDLLHTVSTRASIYRGIKEAAFKWH